MLGRRPEEARARRDIEEALARVQVGDTPALAQIIEPLGNLLEATHAGSHGFEVVDDRVQCAFVHHRRDRGLRADLDRSLESTQGRQWALYDLLAPERATRNRAIAFTPNEFKHLGINPVLVTHGLAVNHVRVLVCEGPSLLAWVGAFREAPLGPRDVALLQSVVPALRRRLTLDRRLETAALTSGALELALERLGTPAYVLAASRRIVHANSAGWQRLSDEGPSLMRRIGEAVAGRDPGFDAHPVSATAESTAHLVIARGADTLAVARTERAITRWGLTPRQSEVLRQLAAGHTNARIAADLGISPRTVEVHVTAIFDRAGCSTRSELLASISTLEI